MGSSDGLHPRLPPALQCPGQLYRGFGRFARLPEWTQFQNLFGLPVQVALLKSAIGLIAGFNSALREPLVTRSFVSVRGHLSHRVTVFTRGRLLVTEPESVARPGGGPGIGEKLSSPHTSLAPIPWHGLFDQGLCTSARAAGPRPLLRQPLGT